MKTNFPSIFRHGSLHQSWKVMYYWIAWTKWNTKRKKPNQRIVFNFLNKFSVFYGYLNNLVISQIGNLKTNSTHFEQYFSKCSDISELLPTVWAPMMLSDMRNKFVSFYILYEWPCIPLFNGHLTCYACYVIYHIISSIYIKLHVCACLCVSVTNI